MQLVWAIIGFVLGAGGVFAFIQFATRNTLAQAKAA